MGGWLDKLVVTFTYGLVGVLGLYLAAEQLVLMRTIRIWLEVLP